MIGRSQGEGQIYHMWLSMRLFYIPLTLSIVDVGSVDEMHAYYLLFSENTASLEQVDLFSSLDVLLF